MAKPFTPPQFPVAVKDLTRTQIVSFILQGCPINIHTKHPRLAPRDWKIDEDNPNYPSPNTVMSDLKALWEERFASDDEDALNHMDGGADWREARKSGRSPLFHFWHDSSEHIMRFEAPAPNDDDND
jgi:hypothetical protein